MKILEVSNMLIYMRLHVNKRSLFPIQTQQTQYKRKMKMNDMLPIYIFVLLPQNFQF